VSPPKLSVRAHGAISDIGREAWDVCAGADNPFVGYDFLWACEESGCVAAEQGWAPRHLSVADAADKVVGVMPLYLKGHSQGEYVFDHAWADAFERAGGDYYPKLLSAVPFTPVTGPRLLSPEPTGGTP
jgi:predicted N-acyltransferase